MTREQQQHFRKLIHDLGFTSPGEERDSIIAEIDELLPEIYLSRETWGELVQLLSRVPLGPLQ
jgi:hypothetical protein